jgi:hypothetical protein
VQGLAVNGTVLYLGGEFSGDTLEFGDFTLTSATGANYSSQGFVAKLVDAGPAANFIWAQVVGAGDNSELTGMAVRGNELYLGGFFMGATGDFGPIRLTTAAAFVGHRFVARLTDAGTSSSFAWALSLGTGDTYSNTQVAASSQGIYIAGIFTAPLTLGSTTLTTAGGSDLFVAKLRETGTAGGIEWAQQIGSSGDEGAPNLVAQGPAVYLAAATGGTTLQMGTLSLLGTGRARLYVTKLLDAGTSSSFQWVQSSTGVQAYPLALLENSGSVYVGGYFGDYSANPSIQFGTTVLTSATDATPRPDAFLARLTDAGSSASFAWAQRVGNVGLEKLTALAVAGNQLYTAGVFTSATLDFGGLALTNAMGAQQAFWPPCQRRVCYVRWGPEA